MYDEDYYDWVGFSETCGESAQFYLEMEEKYGHAGAPDYDSYGAPVEQPQQRRRRERPAQPTKTALSKPEFHHETFINNSQVKITELDVRFVSQRRRRDRDPMDSFPYSEPITVGGVPASIISWSHEHNPIGLPDRLPTNTPVRLYNVKAKRFRGELQFSFGAYSFIEIIEALPRPAPPPIPDLDFFSEPVPEQLVDSPPTVPIPVELHTDDPSSVPAVAEEPESIKGKKSPAKRKTAEEKAKAARKAPAAAAKKPRAKKSKVQE